MTTTRSKAALSALVCGTALAAAAAGYYFMHVQPMLDQYQSGTGQLIVGLSSMFGNGDQAAVLQSLLGQRSVCEVGMLVGAVAAFVGIAMIRKPVAGLRQGTQGE